MSVLLECVEAGVQQEVHRVTGERESVTDGLPVDIAVVDTFEDSCHLEEGETEVEAEIT